MILISLFLYNMQVFIDCIIFSLLKNFCVYTFFYTACSKAIYLTLVVDIKTIYYFLFTLRNKIFI